jgi:hypothetical protein
VEGVRRWPLDWSPDRVGQPTMGRCEPASPLTRRLPCGALITLARGIASDKLVSPLWWAHGSSRSCLIGQEEIALDY